MEKVIEQILVNTSVRPILPEIVTVEIPFLPWGS